MSQDARQDEEQSTENRARILGVHYDNTSLFTQRPLYRDILSLEEMKRLRLIPLQADQSNILFGITTTTSQQTMNAISARFTDQRIAYTLISETGYREYMLLYDPPQKVIYHDISLTGDAAGNGLEEQVSIMLSQVRADDMLAYLVSQAHRLNASDVHIESQVDYVRIRFRIDGILHVVGRLDKDKYRVLIGAIASAGNISTSADEAQQGHIGQKVKMADNTEVDVNVRLETVPTINGIDVVMRLFNMDADKYNLDRLGLDEGERAVLDDIIAKPSGLVLVVGPTGSGKTTTLYSILNSLNSEERKIITIEDPVEYQFPGISQISVHGNEAGNDGRFAEKLRATLRLDPDIVMVGEIRDNDTAKTALQASLTGHLVLSTYHAGSAGEALARLMDTIGQNPLFVSAIRLVMAQRLIRRLDDATKIPRDPTEAEWKRIKAVVDGLPAQLLKPNIDGLKLYDPGSSAEVPFGYSGQLAIREQFRMTGEIRTLLERYDKVLSAQEVESAASKSGMTTMLQSGILHVIAGETTLDEVYRVVG